MIDSNLPPFATSGNKAKTPVESGAFRYLYLLEPGCLTGGVAVYATVGELRGPTTITYPARIDWQLFSGFHGNPDDLPVWEGTTWLLTPPNLPTTGRKGLLVQVSGRASTLWVLAGRLTDAAGANVSLFVQVAMWSLPTDQGGLSIAVGPVVG